MRAASFAMALSMFWCWPAGAFTETQITAAFHARDTEALERMSETLAGEGYLCAYADWRLGSVLFAAGRLEEADGAWSRAERTLDSLVASGAETAEVLALLSSTIGMRIGVSPDDRGRDMGARSARIGKRALAMEPDNPRVLLVTGINKLNTPAFFGGGRKRAMRYFDRALRSVAEYGVGEYAWGESDAYLWRGRAHARAGAAAAACADFTAALAVSPGFGWARSLREDLGPGSCAP